MSINEHTLAVPRKRWSTHARYGQIDVEAVNEY